MRSDHNRHALVCGELLLEGGTGLTLTLPDGMANHRLQPRFNSPPNSP
jgi:hypothetical protein